MDPKKPRQQGLPSEEMSTYTLNGTFSHPGNNIPRVALSPAFTGWDEKNMVERDMYGVGLCM